ncbi:MAG: beta-hexosaminidase [Bacilli bacterium]|nr:beta-hexosaminidase [Bacilli bacterium]
MKKVLILLLLLVISILIGMNYFNNTKVEKKDSKKEEIIENKTIKNSLFKFYSKESAKKVKDMSIEEKVGQLFLVRYDKTQTNKYKDYYPGGYILFAKDFENHTKESIKEELTSLQNNNKYPLILGVDEEGGFVTRVSRFKNFREERFKSPRAYYDEGGYELLEQMENEKLSLLKELGLNLNLAPVADISTNEDDFIHTRSFGKDANETSEFIKNMVEFANNNEINSCLKHFPGYGNNKDTHTGIAIDERSYENFLENDFKPFKAGIDANVPSILVSHNIINCLDSSKPASLSQNVIKELRDTLKFTGIIMTDDLAMSAVSSYVDENVAATLAINAGNDMIITSDFEKMYQEVLNAVNTNEITKETLDTAVTRIIAWKYYSKLFK